MAKLRYVGAASSEIMDTPFQFKRYGQLVEMPDDLAAHAVANGLSLIADDEFKSLGHTDAELAQFGDFRSHPDAPEGFLAKRKAAWTLLQGGQRSQQALAPVAQSEVPVKETVDA